MGVPAATGHWHLHDKQVSRDAACITSDHAHQKADQSSQHVPAAAAAANRQIARGTPDEGGMIDPQQAIQLIQSVTKTTSRARSTLYLLVDQLQLGDLDHALNDLQLPDRECVLVIKQQLAYLKSHRMQLHISHASCSTLLCLTKQLPGEQSFALAICSDQGPVLLAGSVAHVLIHHL